MSGDTDQPAKERGPVRAIAIVLGAVGTVGLIGAMLVDGIAVVGRHVGLPLNGSIEMSQVCVVLLASASIALATIHRGHAVVDLLYQRMGPGAQGLLLRLAALLGFLFLAGVVGGLAWIASDLWNGNEHTELLGIQFAWLRIVSLVCIGVAMIAMLVQIVVIRRDGGGHVE